MMTEGSKTNFVEDMPSDMVLLSAHDYAKDGAAILFGHYGVVLRLSQEEKERLESFVRDLSKRNEVLKELRVNGRTYEVAQSSDLFVSEEAMDSTATRYFNSKVNISNTDERILTMLLTGLTFKDIYSMALYQNVEGFPRDFVVTWKEYFE